MGATAAAAQKKFRDILIRCGWVREGEDMGMRVEKQKKKAREKHRVDKSVRSSSAQKVREGDEGG